MCCHFDRLDYDVDLTPVYQRKRTVRLVCRLPGVEVLNSPAPRPGLHPPTTNTVPTRCHRHCYLQHPRGWAPCDRRWAAAATRVALRPHARGAWPGPPWRAAVLRTPSPGRPRLAGAHGVYLLWLTCWFFVFPQTGVCWILIHVFICFFSSRTVGSWFMFSVYFFPVWFVLDRGRNCSVFRKKKRRYLYL